MPSAKNQRPQKMTPLDLHIAGRLKTLRATRGRTQTWLANYCSTSLPQVQRIEGCKGRVSVSMLADFAEALEVHPGYFYEGFAVGSHVIGTYDPLAAEVSANPDLGKVRLARMMTSLSALPRHMQDTIQMTIRHFTAAAEAEELASIGQAKREAGPKASAGADSVD